jgi:hypothetical protein
VDVVGWNETFSDPDGDLGYLVGEAEGVTLVARRA